MFDCRNSPIDESELPTSNVIENHSSFEDEIDDLHPKPDLFLSSMADHDLETPTLNSLFASTVKKASNISKNMSSKVGFSDIVDDDEVTKTVNPSL